MEEVVPFPSAMANLLSAAVSGCPALPGAGSLQRPPKNRINLPFHGKLWRHRHRCQPHGVAPLRIGGDASKSVCERLGPAVTDENPVDAMTYNPGYSSNIRGDDRKAFGHRFRDYVGGAFAQ